MISPMGSPVPLALERLRSHMTKHGPIAETSQTMGPQLNLVEDGSDDRMSQEWVQY